MKYCKPSAKVRCAVLAGGALLCALTAQAGLVFTIEAPGVQQTSVPGAITETFDDFDLSSSPVGVYSGGVIRPSSVFGGAQSTPFFAVGVQSGTREASLTFAGPMTYFGMWWSAGDRFNQLDFYDQTAGLLSSHRVGDIIPLLSPGYFGNPNGGGNDSEPYVYLNFTTTGDSRITQVKFLNDNLISGFESDNHSIFDQVIDPPGRIPGVSVPEASSTAFLLAFGLSALWSMRRNQ